MTAWNLTTNWHCDSDLTIGSRNLTTTRILTIADHQYFDHQCSDHYFNSYCCYYFYCCCCRCCCFYYLFYNSAFTLVDLGLDPLDHAGEAYSCRPFPNPHRSFISTCTTAMMRETNWPRLHCLSACLPACLSVCPPIFFCQMCQFRKVSGFLPGRQLGGFMFWFLKFKIFSEIKLPWSKTWKACMVQWLRQTKNRRHYRGVWHIAACKIDNK